MHFSHTISNFSYTNVNSRTFFQPKKEQTFELVLQLEKTYGKPLHMTDMTLHPQKQNWCEKIQSCPLFCRWRQLKIIIFTIRDIDITVANGGLYMVGPPIHEDLEILCELDSCKTEKVICQNKRPNFSMIFRFFPIFTLVGKAIILLRRQIQACN